MEAATGDLFEGNTKPNLDGVSANKPDIRWVLLSCGLDALFL